MKKIYYWGPVLIWMYLIYFMSSQKSISTSEVKIIDFIIHKIAHLIEYSVLAVLFYRAVNKGFKKIGNWKLPLILTIIYALSDEVHQLYVATREGKLRDVFIDSFGGALGLWAQKYIFQIQNLKPKKSEKQ
jgi:VanZ family protein